jgi:predicted MFS family arabinose efflux permease
MGNFLGHHWWQGVAAILSLVAIAVSVAIWALSAGGDGPPSISPAPSSSPEMNSITGNCNAQGSHNHVSC